MSALYDTIGVGYDGTRRAEPSIADGLFACLAPEDGGRYLDLACGTGNYTEALVKRGIDMTGVDLSSVMLAQARAKPTSLVLAQSDAARLPFADGSFDGAVTVNTVHHFLSMIDVFREIRRVLRGGRFVVFTGFADQMAHYWIREYFPETMKGGMQQMPRSDEVEAALLDAGFSAVERTLWNVPKGPVDQFLYAGKHKPELYFNPSVISGISTFSSFAPLGEVESGLAALRNDIETGRLEEIKTRYAWDGGDYMFLTARL